MTTFWVKMEPRQTKDGIPVVVYRRASNAEAAENLARDMAIRLPAYGEVLVMEEDSGPDGVLIKADQAPDRDMETVMAELEGRLKGTGLADHQMIDDVARLWNAANDLQATGASASHLWEELSDKLLGESEPALPRLLALAVKGVQ